MRIFYRLVVLAIIGFGMVGNSFARTIIVTTTADLAPAIDGVCSLREALNIAEEGVTIADPACGGLGDPGEDVISLSADTYPLFLTGPNNDDLWGDLDIRTEVRITAPSGIATIESALGVTTVGGRVIEVYGGARVTLQNLLITGGNEGGDGGGILNYGSLTLENVKVDSNRTNSAGGGIASYGGSELFLIDSTISDNTSAGITSPLFDGGGGIWMADSARGTITRSTISGNEADNIGGGILSFSAMASGGSLAVTNTTVSGNVADSGGGIYHSGTSPILIDKTTINNNTATTHGGGLLNLVAETLHLRSAIVAGNLTGSSAPDCSGILYSEGYNIIGILEPPCILLDPLALSADQTGTTATPVNPLLSALGNNGGPTQTHELLTGSPALDSGHPNTCTGTDQRGFLRPSGSGCDIGATEFQFAASRYVVNNNADDGTGCTLRDALQSVVSGTPVAGCVDMGSLGVDTIEFAPAVTGSILLLSDLPTVDRSLHLIGPGSSVLTIDGQGSFPSGLFVDSPGNIANVVVEGLKFQDGFSSTYGAVFHLASNETLEFKSVLIDKNEGSAGCVYVSGNLIVTDSTISYCAGKGIHVNNGTLDISGSTVSDNVSATAGGGVYLQSSTMMASDSVFSGNTAVDGGGGLYVNSGNLRIEIERSTFSGNTAGWGAGIHLLHGELSLVDSAVTGNSSNDPTGSGGGISVNGGLTANISIANSTISGNTAVTSGGGLAVPAGSADIANATIVDNTADSDADGIGHGGGITGSGDISIRNSILSGNSDLNLSGHAPDCSSAGIVSGGFNLVGSTSGCSGATWSGDDIFAAELLMLSLADNGGPTLTHAILPPGPAVDGGDYINGCLWDHDVDPGTGDVVLNWDQRARPRYLDGNNDIFAYCDIGAFEFDPASDIVLWSSSSTLGVALAGTGSGTVTSAPVGIDCGTDCYQLYAPSTSVAMTPTPVVNSYFSGWSGDADCSDGQVVTDAWVSCTATFTLKPVLSVTKAGSGDGTVTSAPAGISCGSDCSELYPPDTAVALIATPVAGSYFSAWSGDADCADGSVVMSSDRSCIATFMPIVHTLTVVLSGNGAGTVTSDLPGIACPGDCSEVYNLDTPITLTPVADPGWLFIGWSGDADCLDGLVTMNADISCSAWFADAYQSYTVTSKLDDNGAGCTLREAVQSVLIGAPSGGCWALGKPGANSIDFAANVTGTIFLTLSDLPVVTKSMQIFGPGTSLLAINGNGSYRSGLVIDSATDDATVSVEGIALVNGGPPPGNTGGAFFLRTGDTLNLSNVVLEANQANNGGGAIYAEVGSTLQISDSKLNGNSTLFNHGGAIYIDDATLIVSDSVFSENMTIGLGGAIAVNNVNSGAVNISGSTFDRNSAGNGGALSVRGDVSFLNSTISRNIATYNGGGIYADRQGRLLSIANTTISGNTADGDGGGIKHQSGSLVHLANVTLTNNIADADANGSGSGGGIDTSVSNGLFLRNSIIHGNQDLNPGVSYPDILCRGAAIVSEDYNLIGDVACATTTWGANDSFSVDPLLTPLTNNGGATLTHRLLAGSPAIDGGNPFSGCSWDDDANAVTADTNLTTDQRGANRYADGDGDTYNVCDRGAFEYNPTGDADSDGILDLNDACVNNLPISTGDVEYASAQTAYMAAVAGDGVLKVQAGRFNMNLHINLPGSILLTGSYSCDFSVQGRGNSALGGTFTVDVGAGPVDLKVIGF